MTTLEEKIDELIILHKEQNQKIVELLAEINLNQKYQELDQRITTLENCV